MNETISTTRQTTALTSRDLKLHYLGHRSLTKKLLEAFPEKEFFNFSIGGMRTAAELTAELLAIGYPGINEIVTGKTEDLNEAISFGESKAKAIQLWEESSEKIAELWDKISEEKFNEEIIAFGKYPGKAWSIIAYYIDNEIHHRAQMYVYLRALGIEPPPFYDRSNG